MDEKKVGSGVLADGVGSIIGATVGSFSNTSFSQNVGLISLTKVASKYVAVMAGIILVILGLFTIFFVKFIPLSVGVLISVVGIIISVYYLVNNNLTENCEATIYFTILVRANIFYMTEDKLVEGDTINVSLKPGEGVLLELTNYK